MEKELILEIGTEEIPAGFLEPAIAALGNIAKKEFEEKLLSYSDISVFGTPRRLTLRITGLSDKQSDKVIETLGPPKRIAYDESGNPTKAALGFAKAQGVDVSELVLVKQEKGELLAVRREIKGVKTDKVLKELLPEIILAIPFRKSMRWGDGDIAFVRPLRWILAIYGGKTVPFSIEGLKSGSSTYGHRFMSPKAIKVSNWEEYTAGLEKGFVTLDQKRRKEYIKDNIRDIAYEAGGTPLDDDDLLETVTHLAEYPVVLKGSFNPDFLKLPKEVLISVMKNHQKYFPVFSNYDDGGLLPNFIFVCGTPAKDANVVINGNQRVIRARFTDAKFFFEEDTKTPLSEKVHKLRGMVFLSEIGTYHDKIERMEGLAGFIAKKLGFNDSVSDIKRAAMLSKADLATQMVFEFPELQGIMGKYYAAISEEKEEIIRAIEEQYMPTSRDGKLPETDFGAVLSITDKVDTISACFISGLTPTGTSDPYALRRQAIGIINIILSLELHLSLREVFGSGLKRIWQQLHEAKSDFPAPPADPSSTPLLLQIMDFIVERFKNLMISEKYSQDVIDAVISAEGSSIGNDLVETEKKIETLELFHEAPDFESLAITFKRVVNIVKGQSASSINRDLLVEPVEQELYESYLVVKEEAEEAINRKEYSKALSRMKTLKEPVDKFFDTVLVMDKDERVRRNRLSTLCEIRELFFKIADFSKISA